MSAPTGTFFEDFHCPAPRAVGTGFAASIAGKPFMERLIRIVVVAIVLGAMAVASHLVPLVAFE
jgi:hypothetical protein